MKHLAAPFALFVLLVVTACGDDGGGNVDAANGSDAARGADASTTDAPLGSADASSVDSALVQFTLTSTVITDGGDFPVKYTCHGDNVSPPLAWSGAPVGTMSYALVFLDTSNGLIHSVMWDIPAATTSLPEAVDNVYAPSEPAGAKQTRAYDNFTRGYLGPCPDSAHLYRFTLHAIDVVSLPGLGMGTTRLQADAAINAASIGTATLEATYTP